METAKISKKEESIANCIEGLSFNLGELYEAGYCEGYSDANATKEFDLLGKENVCFSLVKNLKADDERLPRYKQQRLERGFDDTELWNLDHTIANFILPRLKVFKERKAGYPGDLESEEKWDEILDTMIEFFESYGRQTFIEDKSKHPGWKYFCEYFFNLWD